MAIKNNLVIDQGADFIHNIYLLDQNGDPFNITGYTANAQVRKTFTSTSFKTIDVEVGDENGLVSLSMNSYTTSLLTETRYVYDVLLHSNNVTSRLVEGIIQVNPDVTR